MKQPLLPEQPPRWIVDYMGTPYVIDGRERQGVDCYGLVCWVFRERFGIHLPTFDDFCKVIPHHMEASRQVDVLELWRSRLPDDWVPVEPPYRLCDTLEATHSGLPHCAVLMSQTEMLHSFRWGTRAGGVCRARWVSDEWKRRTLQVYRHKALTD